MPTGGARLLASWGINAYKILSLGRWRSSLVIHYSGEALHLNIAADAARANSAGGSTAQIRFECE